MTKKQETLKKRQEVSAKYKGPRSLCMCGHHGDGVGIDSGGNVNDHGGFLGHGYCTYIDCKCDKFTFKNFTPEFQSVVDNVS